MKKNTRKQKGFTLLEYCAGAAVIIGVVWGAVNTMGGSLSNVFKSVSTWADGQSGKMNGTSGSGGN